MTLLFPSPSIISMLSSSLINFYLDYFAFKLLNTNYHYQYTYRYFIIFIDPIKLCFCYYLFDLLFFNCYFLPQNYVYNIQVLVHYFFMMVYCQCYNLMNLYLAKSKISLIWFKSEFLTIVLHYFLILSFIVKGYVFITS